MFKSEKTLWHEWVDGQEQTLTADPTTHLWRRWGIGWMGLLPIEPQL